MKHVFTKKNILQIQNVVTKILRQSGGTKRSLKELSKDNCSEISRFAGCFVLESYSGVVVRVLKGNRVCNTKQSHDIVAIQEKGTVHAVDPSVWQFFPRKRSIYVGSGKNIHDVLKVVQKIYGGTWNVSEKLSLKTCRKEKDKWLAVINRNNKK